MDLLVEGLVRLVSLIAGVARYLPAMSYARYVPGEPLKVLLVGYNGARNTGSDVRVAALARQACELLRDRLSGSVPLLVSNERDGFVMAAALRSLSVLVTSRYHAQVLSAAASVPTVAVTMDERLANLNEDLGLDASLLLNVDDPDLAPQLLVALDRAWDDADAVRAQVAEGVNAALVRLDGMGAWLRDQVDAFADDE